MAFKKGPKAMAVVGALGVAYQMSGKRVSSDILHAIVSSSSKSVMKKVTRKAVETVTKPVPAPKKNVLNLPPIN